MRDWWCDVVAWPARIRPANLRTASLRTKELLLIRTLGYTDPLHCRPPLPPPPVAEVDPCLDRAAQLSDVCAAIRGHAAPLAADASVREESSGSDESTACAYNAQAAAVEETPSGPATKRRRVDAFP